MANLPAPPQQNSELQYVTPWYSPEDIRENPLKAYLEILRRRKWTILIPLFTTVLIVVWGVLRAKPLYEATTTLFIEEASPQIMSPQEALFHNLSRHTEVEILKDYVLLEKVVDLLLPQGNIALEHYNDPFLLVMAIDAGRNFITSTASQIIPTSSENTTESPDPHALYRDKLIKLVQTSLKVVPSEGTKLVDITLSGYDPQAITQQLNTLVNIYIKNSLDNKLHDTRKILSWLQEEVKDLKHKVVTSASSLQQFRDDKRLFELDDDNPKVSVQGLIDLNLSYLTLKRDEASLEQHTSQLENLSLGEITNSLVISNNDEMKDLKSKYVELKPQLESHSNIYKKNHPYIVALNVQLEDIKDSIIHSLRTEHQSIQKKRENWKEN